MLYRQQIYIVWVSYPCDSIAHIRSSRVTCLTRNPADTCLRFGVVSIVPTLVFSIRPLKQKKKCSIFLASRSRLRETVNKKTTRCVILTLGVKPVQLVIHVLKKLAEGWGQYSTRRKNPEEGIRFRNSNRRSRVCYFPGCRMLPHSIS